VAYKLVDSLGVCANPYTTHSPPRGMCMLEIEIILDYKHMAHQEVCADPYITHSPQKGMCPLGIETIPCSH